MNEFTVTSQCVFSMYFIIHIYQLTKYNIVERSIIILLLLLRRIHALHFPDYFVICTYFISIYICISRLYTRVIVTRVRVTRVSRSDCRRDEGMIRGIATSAVNRTAIAQGECEEWEEAEGDRPNADKARTREQDEEKKKERERKRRRWQQEEYVPTGSLRCTFWQFVYECLYTHQREKGRKSERGRERERRCMYVFTAYRAGR